MHTLLEDLQRGIESRVEGLDSQKMQLRSNGDPARWSVQQIIEHLLLTYQTTASVFEKRLAQGTATRAKPTLQQRIGQFVVLTLGRFPSGRAAPAMVMPAADLQPMNGNETALKSANLLLRFDGLAARAEALFGGRRAIQHQVLGPMSVQQWRQFHLVHGMHHLRQIEAILRDQEHASA